MTKQRSEYIYDLVGIIRKIKPNKIKHRMGLDLEVELSNYSEISTIKVFQDKLKEPTIWTDLTNKNFLDKRFIFYCQNYYGHYHLVSWKELTNHGSN